MDDIIWFHDLLLWVITAITLFVLALLVIVMVKFNARANPTPSRTTHNTTIEVLWTVVPVLILVTIAVPSFRLLFFQLNMPKADRDDKGDRQAVVLEPTAIRTAASSKFDFADGRKPRISSRVSCACSPSTMRWSCR